MPVFQADYITQSPGTVITQIIPPISGMIPRVTDLIYRLGATSHTVTIMRPIAQTTCTANADTGQSIVTLADVSPGKDTSGVAEVLAASDYLMWQNSNGIYEIETVSTVSGNDVTMASNFGTKVNSGASFWAFYEVGRATHTILTPDVSSRNTFANLKLQAGIPGQLDRWNARSGSGDPLIVYSNNVTAAGFFEQISGTYVDPSDVAML